MAMSGHKPRPKFENAAYWRTHPEISSNISNTPTIPRDFGPIGQGRYASRGPQRCPSCGKTTELKELPVEVAKASIHPDEGPNPKRCAVCWWIPVHLHTKTMIRQAIILGRRRNGLQMGKRLSAEKCADAINEGMAWFQGYTATFTPGPRPEDNTHWAACLKACWLTKIHVLHERWRPDTTDPVALRRYAEHAPQYREEARDELYRMLGL